MRRAALCLAALLALGTLPHAPDLHPNARDGASAPSGTDAPDGPTRTWRLRALGPATGPHGADGPSPPDAPDGLGATSARGGPGAPDDPGGGNVAAGAGELGESTEPGGPSTTGDSDGFVGSVGPSGMEGSSRRMAPDASERADEPAEFAEPFATGGAAPPTGPGGAGAPAPPAAPAAPVDRISPPASVEPASPPASSPPARSSPFLRLGAACGPLALACVRVDAGAWLSVQSAAAWVP